MVGTQNKIFEKKKCIECPTSTSEKKSKMWMSFVKSASCELWNSWDDGGDITIWQQLSNWELW